MTKKIFAILVAFVICLSMALSASAYTETYVYDPEHHLSDSEIYEINDYASYIERNTGFTVMFSISTQTDLSNDEYVEMVYSDNTDNTKGICILHNTTEKCYYSFVAGDEEGYFTKDVITTLQNTYDSNESYYGGIMAYYAKAEEIIENAEYATENTSPTESINNEETTKEEFKGVERKLPLVVDNADIISDGAEKALLERCDMFANEYEMEVAIVTVSDLEGKTIEAFADDFYDYNGYGYGEEDDGVLVLYKPGKEGEREIYITTHAKGSGVFTEDIRVSMINDMKDYLADEDYETAFNIYLDSAEEQLKPGVSIIWLFVLMLAGAVIGLIITGSMTAKNKTVASQKNAKVYTRQGSMNVTGRNDVFLYTRTDVQPKAQDNDNDSSNHTSSSGRTHNGSGAKF